MLYFSEFEIVDEKLQRKASSKLNRYYDFKTALLQNVPFGCTQVWNKAAQELLCKHQPDFFYMHDWWNFLVISGVGKILYDASQTLYYRVHGENVFGQTTSFSARMLNRFMLLKKRNLPILSAWRQAVEFQKLFLSYLPPEHQRDLLEFTRSKNSIFNRLEYVFKGRARRTTYLDTLMFKLMVALNYY